MLQILQLAFSKLQNSLTLFFSFAAKLTDRGSYIVPTLVLSAGCSPDYLVQHHDPYSFSIRQQSSPWRSIHPNLTPFSCWSYVMGIDRINSRSCSWKMEIKDKKSWAVGIALESVWGRSVSQLTLKNGIWAVGKSNGDWYAFTSPRIHSLACPWFSSLMCTCLLSHCNATTIQILLNYEEGSVTFLDADNNNAIHSFDNVSFSGQPIFSWFFVEKWNEAAVQDVCKMWQQHPASQFLFFKKYFLLPRASFGITLSHSCGMRKALFSLLWYLSSPYNDSKSQEVHWKTFDCKVLSWGRLVFVPGNELRKKLYIPEVFTTASLMPKVQ